MTNDIVRCPRHFEISLDTHAKLTRCGEDVVPSIAAKAPLVHPVLPVTADPEFSKNSSLRRHKTARFHQSSVTPTDKPMLFGMAVYGSVPSAAVAMLRSDINVCAVVEMNGSLLHIMVERPGDTNECPHFDSVVNLRASILTGNVELPHISIIHATLDSHHPVQVKTSVRFEASEGATETPKLISVLNSDQGREPVVLKSMAVPSRHLVLLEPAIRESKRKRLAIRQPQWRLDVATMAIIRADKFPC